MAGGRWPTGQQSGDGLEREVSPHRISSPAKRRFYSLPPLTGVSRGSSEHALESASRRYWRCPHWGACCESVKGGPAG